MAWLDIKWQLNTVRHEDRGGDEQALQFAIVVTNPDKDWIGVTGYETGNLRPHGLRAHSGRIKVPAEFAGPDRGWIGIPDATKPYFAIVVRALELDNSTDGNRSTDYGAFVQAVRAGCRASAGAGELPTEAQLLEYASSAEIIDRRARDDDDHIGDAVVLWPNFGWPVTEEFYEVTEPGLSSLGFIGQTEVNHFTGDDAWWILTVGASVLTGETNNPHYDTRLGGGFWFFSSTHPSDR